VVTAGRSKSFADPFLPQKPEDVERLKRLQDPIHAAFIDHVKARRGARLDLSADLFNADVWVGQQAIGVGLVDGLAHLRPKMMEMYGEKVRLVPFGQRRSLLQRLGMAATDGLMQGIEERALWARFGL
jgi:serine protease SohB